MFWLQIDDLRPLDTVRPHGIPMDFMVFGSPNLDKSGYRLAGFYFFFEMRRSFLIRSKNYFVLDNFLYPYILAFSIFGFFRLESRQVG